MKLRVLNFMTSLRRMPPLSMLSGQEERMLFDMLEASEAGQRLYVRDAMNLADAPPATAYRQIIALKDKGLIDFCSDEHDKRKKEIVFLAPAMDLMKKLI